jgi:Ca2+-binding RTX toxin-like protein
MAQLDAGPFGLDMSDLDISIILDAEVIIASGSVFRLLYQGQQITFTGSNFSYDASGSPLGGTVTGVELRYLGVLIFQASGFSIPVSNWVAWADAGDTFGALAAVLQGNDNILGSELSDTLAGFSGNDTIFGQAGSDLIEGFSGDDYVDAGDGDDLVGEALGSSGNDTYWGDLGNDTIVESVGSNFLRGEEGNDIVSGGSGFDDIHGNQGNDTAYGNDGDDWVVGGKDNDLLFGDAGFDIVYGNMGNDTVDGGAGNDWVRGGQGDDTVMGGSGDDWIWGDRGNDTISGGAGADLFHAASGAGIDRITDFSFTAGDRLKLEGNPSRTIAQAGADVVVDMGNGDQVILVGVTLSSLGSGWIL